MTHAICFSDTQNVTNEYKPQLHQLEAHHATLEKRLSACENGSIFRGHVYRLSPRQPLDVSRLQNYCLDLGGYLAEVEDKLEYHFVANLVIKSDVFSRENVNGVVLGAKDLHRDNKFYFLHSEKRMTFFIWENPKENNFKWDCLALWKGPMMNDIRCKHSESSVALCEIPLKQRP